MGHSAYDPTSKDRDPWNAGRVASLLSRSLSLNRTGIGAKIGTDSDILPDGHAQDWPHHLEGPHHAQAAHLMCLQSAESASEIPYAHQDLTQLRTLRDHQGVRFGYRLGLERTLGPP